MAEIIFLVLIIVAIVWAFRVETGIAKLNDTVLRIEKHLGSKGEKK